MDNQQMHILSKTILEATLGKNDAWYRGWGTDEEQVLETTRRAVSNGGKDQFLQVLSEDLRQFYPDSYKNLQELPGADLFEKLILAEGNNTIFNSLKLETSLAIWRNPDLAKQKKLALRDGTSPSNGRHFLEHAMLDGSEPSQLKLEIGIAAVFIFTTAVATVCLPLEMAIIGSGLLLFLGAAAPLAHGYHLLQSFINTSQNPTEENQIAFANAAGETTKFLAISLVAEGVGTLGGIRIRKFGMKKSPGENMGDPVEVGPTQIMHEPPAGLLAKDPMIEVLQERFIQNPTLMKTFEKNQRYSFSRGENPELVIFQKKRLVFWDPTNFLVCWQKPDGSLIPVERYTMQMVGRTAEEVESGTGRTVLIFQIESEIFKLSLFSKDSTLPTPKKPPPLPPPFPKNE